MMSPGWQFSSRQMASSVEKRIALALPFLRMERLAGVISTRSASSPSDIFRFAIMTSMLMIIAMSCVPPPCVYCISTFIFSLDREFLLFAQPGSDREDLGREEYQNRHDDVPVVERERGGDLQGRIFEKRPGRTLVNIRADSGADFGQNQIGRASCRERV